MLSRGWVGGYLLGVGWVGVGLAEVGRIFVLDLPNDGLLETDPLDLLVDILELAEECLDLGHGSHGWAEGPEENDEDEFRYFHKSYVWLYSI